MSDSIRHALITGAASGLGRALAVELAKDRWCVGVADLDIDGARETRRLVEQAGGAADAIPLDVRDERQWDRLHIDLRNRWPQLDLLVNNAGVCGSGEVGQAPIEDWDWILSINLRGVFLGCHTMVGWLKENPRRSHILNVSSAAGVLSPPCMAAYNVSKAAVVSLSETLYVELKQQNVGVTVVCPWFIQTNLLETGRFQKSNHRGFGERYMARAKTTPEAFAQKALRATFRNRLFQTVGRRPRLMGWFKQNFRQTFLDLMARMYHAGADSPRSDTLTTAPGDADSPSASMRVSA